MNAALTLSNDLDFNAVRDFVDSKIMVGQAATISVKSCSDATGIHQARVIQLLDAEAMYFLNEVEAA